LTDQVNQKITEMNLSNEHDDNAIKVVWDDDKKYQVGEQVQKSYGLA
jgi:hypothetical protein